MSPTADHTRPAVLAGWPSLLVCAVLAVASGALGFGPSIAAAHGASHARTTPASGVSAYPAAATRAKFTPRQSEFAHSAANNGGASAPGALDALPAKKTTGKSKNKKKKPLTGNPARALAAFEAMQTHYYVRGSGLYEGEPFSYLWPFSQALAATVSMSNIPHLGLSMRHELGVRLYGLKSYLDLDNSGASEGTFTSSLAAFDGTVAPPTGPGGTKYYDDNDWVGIELARAYKLTLEPGLLGSAEGVMAFEMAGWQASPTLACPGGLPFDNEPNNTERNTVTTAPAAELALQLYRLTSNVQYLQFAEMAYQWVRTCLMQPSQLYADHISPTGVVEPMLWSYNQGSMIGAGTLLYQVTGNSEYLWQARQTAKAALSYFTPERLVGENPFFPAVYFRNLLYLDSVVHERTGIEAAQGYVNNAWDNLRLSDDIFVSGTPASAQLLYQAAVVQIYALLSSPASTYF